MKANLLTSALLFFSVLFADPAVFAQGNNAKASGGGPCNTSQPRPITGNQHPCPGSVETYCIQNDRGYTSFVWDVPRAHAGNPPAGWQIISGQGTNCVTVRVGTKSGTMKVTVNDPVCGTKVATLPVKPGRGFIVDAAGPDSVCVNVQQTYTATVADSSGRGNGNGNGQVKGTFTYNWTVPAGWVIVNGQGTTTIQVTPGAADGSVSVTATYVSQGNGNGNNGNGVGGYKGYCNTTASDAIAVDVNNNCGTPPTCTVIADIAGPDTVCAFSDDSYSFTTPAQTGAAYVWTVPADWTIDSGQNTNSITVHVGADPGDVTVTVTNACGKASDIQTVAVNEECGTIVVLPVKLISFEGAASKEGIALSWTTASEKNNDHFEVQRSPDGRGFETVGTVKGNGSSTSLHDYNFVDKAAANGLNYYRLRQVDFNSDFEYSKVIAINAKGSKTGDVTLYPNPTADGDFNIRMTPAKEAVTIKIMDISGKVLLDKQVTDTAELNINGKALGMKAGLYLVSIKTGNSATVEKLLVR
jgi:hypothetical protein